MKNKRRRFFFLTGILLLLTFLMFLLVLKPGFRRNPAKLEYSAKIRLLRGPKDLNIGDRTSIRLRLTNTGRQTWLPSGPNTCLLSYHLREASGAMLRFENPRTSLSAPVAPRRSMEIDVVLRAPLRAGEYVLEFDLLREGVAWFQDGGSPPLTLQIKVDDKKWEDSNAPFSLDYGRYTRIQTSIPEFEQLANLIRLTLDHNAVAFQGRNGILHAFSPGSDYPQIWLRDASTILHASQYYYPMEYLASWLEEHLSHQDSDGGLQDWIDSRGSTEKNTTETDQESSAVIAAYRVYRLAGPAWLKRSVFDVPIIDRLVRALEYPLTHRFDPEHGLLTGAHTADWGDVDIVDDDEKAVDVDTRTHWTCDIYDQSMFYLASRYLAEMLEASGRHKKAAEWRRNARNIRGRANRLLWEPEKGFYRMHVHLGALKHDFDEDDILALGGNTLAVLSGLADSDGAQRILTHAVERQEALGVSTLSGTLYPPYPANFFLHPLCDVPYEYQNGAQWDWFGGRTVTALFENGFSRTAQKKLLEITHKNLKNQGFYEWDDRQGTGRGSDMFSGSAGSLAQALFIGYLGIDLDLTSLNLRPRLGKDSASVHFYQPASDRYAAYEYRFESGTSRLIFEYQSNIPGRGDIEILAPWEPVNEALEFEFLLDGHTADYRKERRGRDLYIIFETDFDRHTLTISPRGR